MGLLSFLNTNEVVAQIINFLILLFVLRIFFWKRILDFLDKRKARIDSEFRELERAKQEAESLKSQYETQLDYMEETAKEKVRQAVEEGKKIVEDMKKDGYVEAQKIIDAAQKDIKYEIVKAKEQMKNEIIELTMRATENLIKEKLTGEDDKKLVEDFLKQSDKT